MEIDQHAAQHQGLIQKRQTGRTALAEDAYAARVKLPNLAYGRDCDRHPSGDDENPAPSAPIPGSRP
jgi:hypothetical protein